ncbi:hypothetical protein D3C83_274150 [compost metagenome]
MPLSKTFWSPRFGMPPASRWAQAATVSRGCHSSGQPVSACSSRMVKPPETTMAFSVRS